LGELRELLKKNYSQKSVPATRQEINNEQELLACFIVPDAKDCRRKEFHFCVSLL